MKTNDENCACHKLCQHQGHNCGNPDCFYFTGLAGPQGPQGETGATGPTGPQGATGPAGVSKVTSYGSFYNTINQTANTSSLPFASTAQAANMTLDPATGVVTLKEAGLYYAHFGVFPTNGAVSVDKMALYLNDAEIPGTARRIENNNLSTVATIINVPASGDKVHIQIISTGPLNVKDLDNVNSYLVLIKIA